MKRAGIEYTEVDIEVDPESAAVVASVNGGNEVVPTLKFPDGTTLTNPPIAEVIAKMAV
jgi:mycoredoxin